MAETSITGAGVSTLSMYAFMISGVIMGVKALTSSLSKPMEVMVLFFRKAS